MLINSIAIAGKARSYNDKVTGGHTLARVSERSEGS
jgi:hypothetical protein